MGGCIDSWDGRLKASVEADRRYLEGLLGRKKWYDESLAPVTGTETSGD